MLANPPRGPQASLGERPVASCICQGPSRKQMVHSKDLPKGLFTGDRVKGTHRGP